MVKLATDPTQPKHPMSEANIQQTEDKKPTVAVGNKGISITNMEELWRFANAVSRSGLAPKGMEKPEAAFIAIQMGLEVGLSPMQALQNIASINGRPSIWGDAALGLVRATGELEDFKEYFEGEPYNDNYTAVCRVKRRHYDVHEERFSVSDAKRAKLWGKDGPWTFYPKRMLRARARGFALRDQFGDALKGLYTAEEARDTPAIDVESTPVEDKDEPRRPKLFGRGEEAEATAEEPEHITKERREAAHEVLSQEEAKHAPTKKRSRKKEEQTDTVQSALGDLQAKMHSDDISASSVLSYASNLGVIEQVYATLDEVAEHEPAAIKTLVNSWQTVAKEIKRLAEEAEAPNAEQGQGELV